MNLVDLRALDPSLLRRVTPTGMQKTDLEWELMQMVSELKMKVKTLVRRMESSMPVYDDEVQDLRRIKGEAQRLFFQVARRNSRYPPHQAIEEDIKMVQEQITELDRYMTRRPAMPSPPPPSSWVDPLPPPEPPAWHLIDWNLLPKSLQMLPNESWPTAPSQPFDLSDENDDDDEGPPRPTTPLHDGPEDQNAPPYAKAFWRDVAKRDAPQRAAREAREEVQRQLREVERQREEVQQQLRDARAEEARLLMPPPPPRSNDEDAKNRTRQLRTDAALARQLANVSTRQLRPRTRGA